jgi:DNA invertase Pin-like site-specific DNA recombinase
MRIGAYLRTSTEGQRDNTSIPVQKTLAMEFAVRNGHSIHLYIDEAKSGGNPSRESYQRLIKDISAGEVQGVWVVHDDRYGRDVEEASRFLKLLIKGNVALWVKGVQRDLSDINQVLI